MSEPAQVTWRIENEFALVEVALARSGGDPVLRVTDLRSGRSVQLDAMALEAVTKMDHERFLVALDPSSGGENEK